MLIQVLIDTEIDGRIVTAGTKVYCNDKYAAILINKGEAVNLWDTETTEGISVALDHLELSKNPPTQIAGGKQSQNDVRQEDKNSLLYMLNFTNYYREMKDTIGGGPLSFRDWFGNPDRRSFARDDLEAWCLEHRSEFFYHALIILAGYRRRLLKWRDKFGSRKCVACAPTRFQDWDRQVREPLIWAGAPDPAQLFERNKAEDPQKAGREVLLEAWFDVYGSEPAQLKQVLQDCNETWSDAHKKGLDDAISDLVPHGRLNSKSFATLLQKFVNQWLGGYRLQKAEQSAKSKSSAKWFVERQLEDRYAVE